MEMYSIRNIVLFIVILPFSWGFTHSKQPLSLITKRVSRLKNEKSTRKFLPVLSMSSQSEEDRIIEESRVKVLQARRSSIRGTLRFAEKVRNLRLSEGWVPELDPETGEPFNSDAKTAVTWTAFAVAAGAIALRIGGRAALISAVGLDFAKDNPEMKQQLDQVLNFADSLNFGTELIVFMLAWTAVKVLCFDAGGIILAISAGILFGGVWQGAIASAASATVGSLVCFTLAKLDTPARKQAISLVEENPSLRGIERVVAKDGFKAILTLRLAPILPIPLGLYNYVYGVTNVPVLDFIAGIFLGSLKPYLLDSYLGVFGLTIVDGSAANDAVGIQDIILLFALGLSVLIGVFASQLASETWDTVLKEVEEEKAAKEEDNYKDDEEELVTRSIAGFELPDFLIDWQVQWGMAEERLLNLVDVEIDAQVWNYTQADEIPQTEDPALAPGAPEIRDSGKGFDFGATTIEGFALSPVLFSLFLDFADPLYKSKSEKENREKERKERRKFVDLYNKRQKRKGENTGVSISSVERPETFNDAPSSSPKKDELLRRVSTLKAQAQRRIDRLENFVEACKNEEKIEK